MDKTMAPQETHHDEIEKFLSLKALAKLSLRRNT